ncbi:hypothetical protein [Deinococcus sp. SL84]|uniref:hypothetical protein n=1 Tax=Deinococcus sp. SL84 TaxID=2994663 RepID=UPI002274C9B5|nr:hypothetical protein [Deinococcus sp. SL84]MCY1703649.1 hypothetical protein [Deinococcus sp. SL84]
MSKKAGPGRKTKLTPELQAEFVKVLRSGNWIETACSYVGIHPDTYYEWMKRGESSSPSNQIYRAFRDAVLEARAAAEMECVIRIRMAGSKGNVKADMWFLERSFPERWGRRRVEVTGKDGEPLKQAQGTVVIIPSNGRDE